MQRGNSSKTLSGGGCHQTHVGELSAAQFFLVLPFVKVPDGFQFVGPPSPVFALLVGLRLPMLNFDRPPPAPLLNGITPERTICTTSNPSVPLFFFYILHGKDDEPTPMSAERKRLQLERQQFRVHIADSSAFSGCENCHATLIQPC